jgi:hypothetical protein
MDVGELLLGGLIGAIFSLAASELWHWIRPSKDEVILNDLLILLRTDARLPSENLDENLEQLRSLAVEYSRLRSIVQSRVVFLVFLSVGVLFLVLGVMLVSWREFGAFPTLSFERDDFPIVVAVGLALCGGAWFWLKDLRIKINRLRTLNKRTSELKRQVRATVNTIDPEKK